MITLKYICSFFLVITACGLIGCARSQKPDNHQIIIAELREIAYNGTFRRDDKASFPVPQRLDPKLAAIVSDSYESNPQIRSLVAHYFLRYDQTLLVGGLLTVATNPPDLIAIIWDKEAQDIPELRESPSTLIMREHIRMHEARFVLSDDSKRVLEENVKRFKDLQQIWLGDGFERAGPN